jgi:hypothetical protein
MDYCIIASRLTELYDFAAACLGEPRITTLVSEGTPCYSWPAEERAPWFVGTTRPLARAIALATDELRDDSGHFIAEELPEVVAAGARALFAGASPADAMAGPCEPEESPRRP